MRCLWALFVWAIISDAFAQSNCSVEQRKPIGTATQGGYQFDYESAAGPDCREYRARNRPGRRDTPILWRHERETLLDVDLGGCQAGSECPWMNSVKIWSALPATASTVLGFGPNKLEYTETPDAFTREQTSANLPPYTTRLFGSVAASKDRAIKIAVEVTSRATCTKSNGCTLDYTMRLLEDSEELQLLVATPKEGMMGLSIVWDAAGSKPFFEQLIKANAAADFKAKRAYTTSIRAKSVATEESKILAVYNGAKRIAATTAPSYLPSDR